MTPEGGKLSIYTLCANLLVGLLYFLMSHGNEKFFLKQVIAGDAVEFSLMAISFGIISNVL